MAGTSHSSIKENKERKQVIGGDGGDGELILDYSDNVWFQKLI